MAPFRNVIPSQINRKALQNGKLGMVSFSRHRISLCRTQKITPVNIIMALWS